ncbi:MAG TPA: XRE family transcriptional regulator [Gammaproteobacteria bacterium]|nr:XRE family transcriptional regulator [Gammaproteobacteria bacterium]
MKTLREIRINRNTTIEGVAKQCGVTKCHISLIERGLRYPSRRTARKIAQWYGVSLEQVMYGNE